MASGRGRPLLKSCTARRAFRKGTKRSSRRALGGERSARELGEPRHGQPIALFLPDGSAPERLQPEAQGGRAGRGGAGLQREGGAEDLQGP